MDRHHNYIQILTPPLFVKALWRLPALYPVLKGWRASQSALPHTPRGMGAETQLGDTPLRVKVQIDCASKSPTKTAMQS